MDFAITDEQAAIVATARRFGERRLAPFYKQREREGAFDRPTLAVRSLDTPVELFPAAVEEFGVDPEQNLDRLTGPLGDLGRGDSSM